VSSPSLVIDLPPGTGDVQLSLAQSVPMTGAVIVTTPQDVSLADVSRGIEMFRQVKVPVLGIVENMSGFVCSHCGETTDIFGSGGGRGLAQTYDVPFLGTIPLDPRIRLGGGDGQPLMAAAPDSIITVDRAGRIVLANTQAERLFGYATGELLGIAVERLVPEASRAAHLNLRAGYAAAPWTRPMGSGLDLAGLRKDGSAFPVEIHLSPYPTDEGLLVTAIIRDVSDGKAAEARQRLLAEVGVVLGMALDEATTLQRVASLAIPSLADFAAVDLLDHSGRIHRAAMAHRQPEQEAMVQEMHHRFPLELQRETLVTHAIRSGTAALAPEVGDDLLRSIAQNEDHLRLLQALGLRSLLVVPLIARGAPLGGIVLAYTDSGRRYTLADQVFAEDLARRAALAIDNARLYRQAQEAVQARDAFFAAGSHDLRNPLAAIKMIGPDHGLPGAKG